MGYVKQKLPRKNAYRVKNAKTGVVHAKATTKKKAESQIKLLNAIDHGFKPMSGGSIITNALNPLKPLPLQLRFM